MNYLCVQWRKQDPVQHPKAMKVVLATAEKAKVETSPEGQASENSAPKNKIKTHESLAQNHEGQSKGEIDPSVHIFWVVLQKPRDRWVSL